MKSDGKNRHIYPLAFDLVGRFTQRLGVKRRDRTTSEPGSVEDVVLLRFDLANTSLRDRDLGEQVAYWSSGHFYHRIRQHSRVRAAMKAGAVKFLSKSFPAQDLLDAILLAIEQSRVWRRDAAVIAGLQVCYHPWHCANGKPLGVADKLGNFVPKA
jgi:hypothetical protein